MSAHLSGVGTQGNDCHYRYQDTQQSEYSYHGEHLLLFLEFFFDKGIQGVYLRHVFGILALAVECTDLFQSLFLVTIDLHEQTVKI